MQVIIFLWQYLNLTYICFSIFSGKILLVSDISNNYIN